MEDGYDLCNHEGEDLYPLDGLWGGGMLMDHKKEGECQFEYSGESPYGWGIDNLQGKLGVEEMMD